MTKAKDKQIKEFSEVVKSVDIPEEVKVISKKPGIIIEQNRAWRIKMGIQEA